NHLQRIVGGDRELIFGAAQQHECSADVCVLIVLADGSYAAESKSTEIAEPAREETFENRRVITGETDCAADREDLLARSVRPFRDRKVLTPFEGYRRERKVAKSLLVIELQKVT